MYSLLPGVLNAGINFTLLGLVNAYATLLDPSCLSHTFSLLTGDYSSVFSLVTNTELQPVKTLMSHALVCPL